MKKVFIVVLCLITIFLTACNSNEVDRQIGDNGNNDYCSKEKHYSVTVKSQDELVAWMKSTDVMTKYEGQYKELDGWKTKLREVVIPYYQGEELSTDISILPESKMEASGIYFRHYTEELTCIIQIYRADSDNLEDIKKNLCRYRFGKKTIDLPNDAMVGKVVIGGKEVDYGLSHSEPMERTFLTFLYSDCYVVTIGYMDTSTIDLFDFLEKLSFDTKSF